MLVNDPQTVFSGGKNERFAQLTQRTQRAKLVKVGCGLLGLDHSCFRCGIGAGSAT